MGARNLYINEAYAALDIFCFSVFFDMTPPLTAFIKGFHRKLEKPCGIGAQVSWFMDTFYTHSVVPSLLKFKGKFSAVKQAYQCEVLP